jgi:cell wall-associated NlpC family hydrolase
MLGQDLPSIGAKLTGEISDLMAKLAIVQAEIKKMKMEAGKPTEIKIAEDLQKELNKVSSSMKGDLISKAVKDSLKEADPEYQNAGQSAAQRFAAGWKQAMKKENINTPGWLPWLGAGLSIAPSLITGLAGAVGGLAVGAGAAAAGMGGLAAAAMEVLGPVKQAFTTIDQLNTKNTIGANATALQQWLKQKPSVQLTGSTTVAQVQQRIKVEQMRIAATQARIAKATTPSSRLSAQATLLSEQGILQRYQQQITPTKNSLGPGLGFLASSKMGPDSEILDWYTLSAKQKAAVVAAAQHTTGMPTSEKAQITALMQERQAYTGLNPGQAKALFQYTKFDQTMVAAQDKAQPAVLGLFGAGLSAVEPVLKYITPLANTAAKALTPLIKEIGADFKSSGFSNFMNLLIKLAGSSISTIGKTLIDVGTGIGHIFEGIGKSGLAQSMLGDILKAANAFKNWTGGTGFTQFLTQMKSNAPTVMAILHNLLSIIGNLVKGLSGGLGHLELTGLNLVLHLLADLSKLPLGGFLYNMAALVLVFSKFGSLKLVGALWDMLYRSLGKMIAMRTGVFIANMLGVETAGKKLGEVWSGIGNKVLDGFKGAANAVVNWGKGAAQAALNWGKSAFQSIGQISGQALSALKNYAVAAGNAVLGWGKNFISFIGNMASSVVSFVVSFGKQLVKATIATAVWIAEHTAAAASFIAENVAMAASATAAFIAENAATLGIAAAIALLVTAIIYLATHWSRVWNDVKHWAEDAWNFIYNGFGKYLLPLLGPVGLIALGAIELAKHWTSVWDLIKRIALDWWHWFGGSFVVSLIDWLIHKIPGAFDTAVSLIGRAWNAVKEAVMTPINWIVRYVIDDTLIKAFDWVSHAVGGPTIQPIKTFGMKAGGKITKGTTSTADDVLARVSKNETVVSANHSRLLAPVFSMLGVPGYATGGVPLPGNKLGKQRGTMGSLVDPIGSFFSKIFDIGKIMTALVTGNSTALTKDFMQLIGYKGNDSGATGDIAKLLTAVPHALVGSLVHFLIKNYGMGSSSAIVRYAESFIGKVPYLWGGTSPVGWDCSGFVQYVYEHFGFNPPRTSELQWNWVQRTPQPVLGGLAFFAGADGTQQNPGHVGIVVNNNRMVDAYGTGFGTRFNTIFGSSGAVSGFGVPPRGFKGGGAHTPGVGGGVVNANARLAQSMYPQWGSGTLWNDWWNVGMRESGWSSTAQNPSGALGIAQALGHGVPGGAGRFGNQYGGFGLTVPGDVLADSGVPNPQITWMYNYIKQTYGNPAGAWNSELKRGYYDQGGWLKPGHSGTNLGPGPEAVLTPQQSHAFIEMARMAASAHKGGLNPTRLNNLFHYWTSHYAKWISQHKPYSDLHGKALETYWEDHWSTWIKHNIGTSKGSGGGGGGGGTGGHGAHHHHLTGRALVRHNLEHYYATDQTRTDASLRAEERYYIKEIGKYFKGADKRRDEREVRKQTDHLLAIRGEITKMNNKISNAKAYQQNVLSSLSGYADLSNYTLGSAVINGKNATPGQFLAYQQKQSLGNLKHFSQDLKKLTQMHAPAWLIQQIVSMGVDQGSQYADEIIQGGPGLIKQLNATQQQINKEELAISRGAASSVYEGKYNTSKNFLDGLEKDKARLERLFRDVGDEMGKEAAKWFHRLPKGHSGKHHKMASGGVIGEQVWGVGASGDTYEFGEDTNRGILEQVTPIYGGSMRRQGVTVQVFTNEINPVYHAAVLGFELARRSG